MLFSAATLTNQAEATEPADWMSGEFGVSWRISPDISKLGSWDPVAIADQVESMPGVKYVLFNISKGAYGDQYISYHPVLWSLNPHKRPTPGAGARDVFELLAQEFQSRGIKVIAYIACQGPAMLKAGAAAAYDKPAGQVSSQAMNNWAAHVQSTYANTTDATYKQAFGEIIFEEYASRYGTLIDGWWLDNGSDYYDAQQLFDIARIYNPNSVLASNGHKSYMSYRNGHPLPLNGVNGLPPSQPANEAYLLSPIEATTDGLIIEGTGEKTLGHMYMPAQELWNSGALAWDGADEATGIDWKSRCLAAGGAWTWNLDVVDNQGLLRADAVNMIQDIIAALPASNSYPLVQIRKRNALSYCLNGGGAAPFPTQNVKLSTYSPDHVAMTWEEIDRGNGFYSYQRVGTNYSIDGGNSGINGQNVYLWPTDATNYNQQWQKVSTDNGFVKLKKRNAAFGINGGNGGANLQNVNLYNSGNNSHNLQWEIEYR